MLKCKEIINLSKNNDIAILWINNNKTLKQSL